MSENKLSVVIPSYNESENLKKGVLNEVANYLEEQDYKYEVIIVDDGSRDESVSLVQKIIKGKQNFSLIKNPHGGKAISVMTGLLFSKGEIALFTDMDQATPISEIEKFFPKFLEGFDIVIGSRHGRKGAPIIRKLMGFGFSFIRNIILGLPFSDTQCGFKAFNRKAREEIFNSMIQEWEKLRAKGPAVNAGFDVEALFLAKKRGFRIAEVNVDWHHVGTERVQAIKDSFDAIRDVLRIRLNDLSGKYA